MENIVTEIENRFERINLLFCFVVDRIRRFESSLLVPAHPLDWEV